MKKKLVSILLVFIVGIAFSCGSKRAVSNSDIEEPAVDVDVELEEATAMAEPGRAERVIRSLIQAYPDRIVRVEFKNDDWAFLLDDTWFYYAGGSILPEHRLEYLENYRPFGFYYYPAELTPWVPRTPEETARFRSWQTNRRESSAIRAPYFLNTLWQASTRTETESRMERITFLGRQARIHRAIQNELRLVETRILAIAAIEPEVQEWINNLDTRIEAYGWRNIADTQARSYHSYGIAIDLLPRSLGRMQTYWLWTADHREDWWNVPYTQRYHPPDSVIKAFETYGFIWGGKWPLFDTMHFEYRPELLILNGLYRN